MKNAVWVGFLLLLLLVLSAESEACTLCNLQNKQTLRTEMKQAKVVAYGQLANPQFNTTPGANPGTGSTELQILKVLQNDALLGSQQTLTINSYIPILDKKNPPLYVVFAREEKGKLDVYHGRSVETPALFGYLEGIKKLDNAPALPRLSFYFQYLDHADSDIATDAFLEFAKTDDKDLAEIAPKLNSDKFRKLLLNPKTSSEKIGLFAFLLAGGKNLKDADLLRGMIEKPTAKTQSALDGLLCGLIQLQPEEGWKLVYSTLGNKKKNFNDRFAAFRVVRFYYNWQPKENKAHIMHGLEVMLAGDLADLAIDALRRWEEWGMTAPILGLHGKKGFTAPIMERAIVRYAMCCPLPQAKMFVEQVRKTNPGLVQEIEQDLQFEKKLAQTSY